MPNAAFVKCMTGTSATSNPTQSNQPPSFGQQAHCKPPAPGDSLPAAWPCPRSMLLLLLAHCGRRALPPGRLEAVERLLLLEGLTRPSRRCPTPDGSSRRAVMDSWWG